MLGGAIGDDIFVTGGSGRSLRTLRGTLVND